jgi:hypothetical protein
MVPLVSEATTTPNPDGWQMQQCETHGTATHSTAQHTRQQMVKWSCCQILHSLHPPTLHILIDALQCVHMSC